MNQKTLTRNVCSNYVINVDKYGVKCGTSLRFSENKRWTNSIDPYDWFQWTFRYWLGRRSLDKNDNLLDEKEL